jgi:hypothetical protein
MRERRLAVNPEPLKIVEARPGDKVIELKYLFAQRVGKSGRLLAASVHRDWCRRAPRTGTRLKDGSKWSSTEVTLDQVNAAVGEAEKKEIEVKVWCSSCGGWSVSR